MWAYPPIILGAYIPMATALKMQPKQKAIAIFNKNIKNAIPNDFPNPSFSLKSKITDWINNIKITYKKDPVCMPA